MDKFDKLFHDKLQEITENEFKFSNSSWERFQNQWQMEESDNQKSSFLVWLKRNLTAAAIISLLLMSNIFFAKQFLNTRNEIKKLTSTIDDFKINIAICQKQTVDYEQTVARLEVQLQTQTDLINENKNKNITELLSINSKLNNNNNNRILTTNHQPPNANLNTSKNLDNANSFSLGNNLKNENENIDEIRKSLEQELVSSDIKNIELNRLNFRLNNQNLDSTKWATLPNASEYNNPQKTSWSTRVLLLAEAGKPTDYQIGAGFQFAVMPTFKEIEPILVMNTGINTNALFFNNLRIGIGVNKWTHSINFENIQQKPDGYYNSILPNFTTLNPTNPQDELTKIEGNVEGFDFPLELKVLLRPNKKWNTYLGFGVVGRYYDNYNFEQYFYEHGNPSYDYEIDDLGRIHRFDWGLWQVKAELDYALSQYWFVNTELSYLKNYQEQVFGLKNLQQFGVRLGIKYQF